MTATNQLYLHKLNPDNWNEEFRPLLLKVAIGKVNDYQIAEDLVQETFISAWKARDRFRGECSEKTYLSGILRNKIIDHYRAKGRNPIYTETQLNSQPDQDDNQRGILENYFNEMHDDQKQSRPSAVMERDDFFQDLDRAIDQLPAKMAQAFRLSVLEEHSTQDITRKLDISSSNLWVMIHRAKRLLRTELAAEWRD